MIGIIWVDLCKGLNLFIKLVKKINDTLISKLLKQINQPRAQPNNNILHPCIFK